MEPHSRPGRLRAPLSPATRRVGRREFLLIAGGATAYLALRPHAAWAARPKPLYALAPWSLPLDPPSGSLELARALIGAAVLAPSDWNTQPWRFEVEGTTIRLLADPQRALPITDPDRRGMLMALGAALENLLVAARAWGMQPAVRYFPPGGRKEVVAEVTLEGAGPRRDLAAFGALTARRTNRRNYDGRGLMPEHRAQLDAQVTDGTRLRWLDQHRAVDDLSDLVHDAVHAQVSNRRVQTEQRAWLRLSENDARRHGDGVLADDLGMSGPAHWFAGRYFDPESWFLRFGSESAAKHAREGVRTSGAVALLSTPERSESSWLMAGQAYERLALRATQLGLAQQPINAPVEVERFRGALLRRFGAGGEEPLLLVRFGHAKGVQPSMRRALALVATFRNS